MELFLKGEMTYKRKEKKKKKEEISIAITSVYMPIPSMVCSYIFTRQVHCFGLN